MTANGKNIESVPAGGSEESDARKPIRDGIDTVRHAAGDTADRVAHAVADGRDKALGAYASGRDKASDAYQHAFDRARSTADRVDANPLSAIAGGIAIGVLVGALLPRTEREGRIYGALGDRLAELAVDAAGAARAAGQTKLTDMGVHPDRGRDIVRTIVDAAVQAAVAAATAALATARTGGTRH